MNAYQNLKTITKRTFLLSLLLTLLTACGGGGGNSGPTYPSITYTGATGAATVDASNASDFPVTFLDGSSSSAGSNPLGASMTGTSSGNTQQVSVLKDLANKITKDTLMLHSATNTSVTAAVTSETGTCSGSKTTNDNSTQSNLDATITLDHFCTVNTTDSSISVELHGRMHISGSYSANPTILHTITVSVEYMKYTLHTSSGTFSEEFAGSMTLTFDGTTANIMTGLSISTVFQANGLTYKIENLTIDNSSGLAIGGTFYHPLHGYVTITTPVGKEFTQVSTNPDKYCGGSLKISGSGGVIDFTADATCSTYDICFTPDGGVQSCTTSIAWP